MVSNYQHKEGTGTLFVNIESKKDPKKPCRSGSFCLNGKQYNIAGWVQTDRETGEPILDQNGNPRLSLRISEKQSGKDFNGYDV